ncbi:hypothetical protein [Arthrobacter sp. YAF16]|uniref:hypothetical protein n=1 Tax=Arthrobacter sp. YAF16 TaxID=3233076 RepID=UPI003F8E2888
MNSQEHNPSDSPLPSSGGASPHELSSTHVTHVREDVAMAGRCANVHLPTGRTCTLPVRHPGACSFVGPEEAETIAVH